MQVQPGMSSNILDKLLDFWYLSIFGYITSETIFFPNCQEIGKYEELNFFLCVGHTSETKENIG